MKINSFLTVTAIPLLLILPGVSSSQDEGNIQMHKSQAQQEQNTGSPMGGEVGLVQMPSVKQTITDSQNEGTAGIIGDCGTQGATVVIGDCGNQGATVVIGDFGNQGAAGVIGDCGNQGATVVIGDCGNQGATVVIGDCGNQGATGVIGDSGNQGAAGVIGDSGNEGATGVLAPSQHPPMSPCPPQPIDGQIRVLINIPSLQSNPHPTQ